MQTSSQVHTRINKDLTCKANELSFKAKIDDLNMVLKDFLRTRPRTNITDVLRKNYHLL